MLHCAHNFDNFLHFSNCNFVELSEIDSFDEAKKYLFGNSCDFVRTNAVIRPPPPQNNTLVAGTSSETKLICHGGFFV